MYPLFSHHQQKYDSIRTRVGSHSARLNTLTAVLCPNTRIPYGCAVQEIVRALRRPSQKTLTEVRRVITSFWKTEIFGQRSDAAFVRGSAQLPTSTSFLTPVEIELTKKALVAGLNIAAINQSPISHLVSDEAELTGRWDFMIEAVLDHVSAQIKENTRAPAFIEYWLLFAFPNGVDCAATRLVMNDCLAHRGLSLQQVGDQRYVMMAAFERESVAAIPIYGYVGHSCHKDLAGATMVGVNIPNCASVYPKRPFHFHATSATDTLTAHPGQNTVVVADRADLNRPVELTAGSFPLVFPGQHALGRAYRALQLAQHLTAVSLVNPIEEISAWFACQMINPLAADEPDQFRDGNTNVFVVQHECFVGLTMDRAPGVHLSGTAPENANRLINLLRRFDSAVTQLK